MFDTCSKGNSQVQSERFKVINGQGNPARFALERFFIFKNLNKRSMFLWSISNCVK